MDKVLAAIEANIESRLLAMTVTAAGVLAAFALIRKVRAPKHKR